MSRFNGITLPFIILIIAVMSLSFIEYDKSVREHVETMQARYSVNYAVDAAVDVLIQNSQDLGLDYADYTKVSISPQEALDTFLEVYCLSNGLPLNEDSYALVKEEYLSAFAVATYDGYYIAKSEQIRDDGTRAFLFSIKQPYLYEKDASTFYALNLGGTDAKEYSGTTIRKVDAPISTVEQQALIGAQVSDAIMRAVRSSRDGNISSTIFLPSAMTGLTKANAINGVTVLAYISDINIGYGQEIELFGVGGSRIAKADYFVGYERSGVKLYTKAESAPEGVVILGVFSSANDAAAAGYYYDVSN